MKVESGRSLQANTLAANVNDTGGLEKAELPARAPPIKQLKRLINSGSHREFLQGSKERKPKDKSNAKGKQCFVKA